MPRGRSAAKCVSMSRYGIEKACYDLANADNHKAFLEDPDGYLAGYPLDSAEREMIKAGEVGALYVMDVSGGALAELMRVFNYDMAEYVARLRQATGLPDDAEQLRAAAPEIVDAARRLLDRVRAGELGYPPCDEVPASAGTPEGEPALVRSGWL